MTDRTEKAEQKAAKGAMKEAIGLIAGDREAESDGAKVKAAGEREASTGRNARDGGRRQALTARPSAGAPPERIRRYGRTARRRPRRPAAAPDRAPWTAARAGDPEMLWRLVLLVHCSSGRTTTSYHRG